MLIKYLPAGINNFHNRPALSLRVSQKTNETGEYLYLVSPRTAAKIERHFCGMMNCCCPHGAAIQIDQTGTRYGIPSNYTQPIGGRK